MEAQKTEFTKSIDCDGAVIIGSLLKNNTIITRLKFHHQLPGRDGIKSLSDAFKNNTALHTVELSYNELQDDDAKQIGCSLISDAYPVEFVHTRSLGLTFKGTEIESVTAQAEELNVCAGWNIVKVNNEIHISQKEILAAIKKTIAEKKKHYDFI